MAGNTDKAMREYLDALFEEQQVDTAEFDHEPVAKLLSQASAPVVETPPSEPAAIPEPLAAKTPAEEAPVEPTEADEALAPTEPVEQTIEQDSAVDDIEAAGTPPEDPMAEYQRDDFQALFFTVAGLTLAVPLKSLGQIHNLGKLNTLFGRPKWFKGVMTERGEQIQVVDTARWVMPEKLTEQRESEIEYQYVITLNDSSWGLACEDLVTSTPLQPQQVQWRKPGPNRRPWLAGVVREKMCALLDVPELITLLNNGLGHTKDVE